MRPESRYKPGDKIGGRYLVHDVKMGGMGEVYLSLDLETNKPYALKTFQQRYLNASDLRETFEKEVSTWVSLEKHHNIVRCFHMSNIDNQPFMFLEWIASDEGQDSSLRTLIRYGTLNNELVLRFAIDICRGLIHAQNKSLGFVHRDLKPENILVAKGGIAKITDFGLAKIAEKAGLVSPKNEAEIQKIVLKGTAIAGTPGYMAPEIWFGESFDERADIYALGCILYEMLTREPAFRVNIEPNDPQQFQKWLNAIKVEHIEGRLPIRLSSLPLEEANLIRSCLAQAKEERPSSCIEILEKLTHLYWQFFKQAPPARQNPGEFNSSDYINRGVTYVNLKMDDLALHDYNRAIELDPKDPQPYSNRGATYLTFKDYERALQDCNRAIELDSGFAQAYSNRGGVYFELVQYEQSMDDFNRALELDPHYVQAHYNRALLYKTLHQNEHALDDYYKIIELAPNHAKANLNIGILLFNSGKLKEALAYAEKANEAGHPIARNLLDEIRYSLEKGSDNPNLSNQMNSSFDTIPDEFSALSANDRGVAYHNSKQYEIALGQYNRAIKLNPNLAQAYSNRGFTYHKLNQYQKAISDFNEAIKLDPTFPMSFLNRGNTYLELDYYEQALIDYNQAIQLKPDLISAYINRGITFRYMKRYESSLESFSRAIELDSSLYLAYYNRGLTYQSMERYESAVLDYRKSIELESKNPKPYFKLGELFFNIGKLQTSLSYYEMAAKLGAHEAWEKIAEVRVALGLDSAEKTNQYKKALNAFNLVSSLEMMQQIVAENPSLREIELIKAIEWAINQQVPVEQQPTYRQRLKWLNQIVDQ